jgi:hypothetical protein
MVKSRTNTTSEVKEIRTAWPSDLSSGPLISPNFVAAFFVFQVLAALEKARGDRVSSRRFRTYQSFICSPFVRSDESVPEVHG